jgi:hypothetical protein
VTVGMIMRVGVIVVGVIVRHSASSGSTATYIARGLSNTITAGMRRMGKATGSRECAPGDERNCARTVMTGSACPPF